MRRDYRGDKWYGTSHESENVPGAFATISSGLERSAKSEG